jgi:hypothetical protein
VSDGDAICESEAATHVEETKVAGARLLDEAKRPKMKQELTTVTDVEELSIHEEKDF